MILMLTCRMSMSQTEREKKVQIEKKKDDESCASNLREIVLRNKHSNKIIVCLFFFKKKFWIIWFFVFLKIRGIVQKKKRKTKKTRSKESLYVFRCHSFVFKSKIQKRSLSSRKRSHSTLMIFKTSLIHTERHRGPLSIQLRILSIIFDRSRRETRLWRRAILKLIYITVNTFTKQINNWETGGTAEHMHITGDVQCESIFFSSYGLSALP